MTTRSVLFPARVPLFFLTNLSSGKKDRQTDFHSVRPLFSVQSLLIVYGFSVFSLSFCASGATKPSYCDMELGSGRHSTARINYQLAPPRRCISFPSSVRTYFLSFPVVSLRSVLSFSFFPFVSSSPHGCKVKEKKKTKVG